MAQHRTYIVLTPAAATAAIDICVQGPVGTKSAPVSAAVGGTSPPAGWNGGAGAYYEWRGRTLRLETLAGATAFAPRARLGFHVSIAPIAAAVRSFVPGIQLSQSLVQNLDGGSIIAAPDIADPSYGPVIRLTNSADVENMVWVVNFSIFEPSDDAFDPSAR